MAGVDRVWNEGQGAVFLYLYSAVILFLLPLESFVSARAGRFIWLIGGVIPPAVVVFLSREFNDGLMDFFAGEVIEEAFETVDERTGEDSFYWDADSETKEMVDEMDQKAHSYMNSILSGAVIAGSLPFVVYYFAGVVEAVASVLGSLLVLYLLSYRSYRNLRQVVKSSVRLYDVSDED